ncbi:MAG: GAF domain-containing protein [Anaerolineae bacterium]
MLNGRAFNLLGFSRRTIRQRIILGNLMIGLLVLLAAAVALWQFSRLLQAVDVLNQASDRVAVVMEVRQQSTSTLATVSRLLPAEDADAFTANVGASVELLRKGYNDLAAITEEASAEETEAALLGSVSHSVESVIDISDTMVRQAAAEQWPSVRVRVGVLARDQEQLASDVDRLVDLVRETELQATEQFVSARRAAVLSSAAVILLVLILGTFLLWEITRSVARPVERLTQAVAGLAAGSLEGRVPVESADELGQLAMAFNSMADRIQSSYAELEQRVAERTRALKTSADVSRNLSTILDQQQLISEVVSQVQSAFNYYHVHIYLFDEKRENLRMVGGTGEAGRKMLEDGFTIPRGKGLVGRAADTNQIVVVQDVAQDPDWLPNPLLPETKSEAAVPIAIGDKVLGVLDTQQNVVGGLDESAGDFLSVIASQVAIALENARLFEETRGRVAQLRTVNRLSIALSAAPTLRDVFDSARREIMQMLDATGMSISLLTPDQEKLHWIYGYEHGAEVSLAGVPLMPITQGFSGHVARTGEVLLLNENVDEAHETFQSVRVGSSSNSWLGLPLIVANELIGVLAVENNAPFGERELEVMELIVRPLAIAINNLLQFGEVEKALEAQSQQRVQLQAAAEVSAVTTSILALDELIDTAVNVIKEHFSLYYVGLFLVDAEGKEAELRAGTGEAGRIQLEQKRCLKVGGRSLIGGATSDGSPRIIQDVTLEEQWLPNPMLPDTRSELALPLRVRGRIIGALTVQDSAPNAFSTELIATLQTMADQLAIAIENAQLLADAEARAQQQLVLNQISAQLHRSADVGRIIDIGLRAVSQRLGGAKVELTIGNKGNGEEPRPQSGNGRPDNRG